MLPLLSIRSTNSQLRFFNHHPQDATEYYLENNFTTSLGRILRNSLPCCPSGEVKRGTQLHSLSTASRLAFKHCSGLHRLHFLELFPWQQLEHSEENSARRRSKLQCENCRHLWKLGAQSRCLCLSGLANCLSEFCMRLQLMGNDIARRPWCKRCSLLICVRFFERFFVTL